MKTQEIIILIVLIFFILFFINNNRQENYNITGNFNPAEDPDNWLRDHCDRLCSSFPDISVDCIGRKYPNICIAKCKGEITSTCIPINPPAQDYKNPDEPIEGNYGGIFNIDYLRPWQPINPVAPINRGAPIEGNYRGIFNIDQSIWSPPINRGAPIDGCTNLNQACTCRNTGWSGRCGFGRHHPGRLYCRCD